MTEETAPSDLQSLGLTKAEYHVLWTLYIDYPMSHEKLVEMAIWELGVGLVTDHNAQEYEQAVAACQSRGWIAPRTEDECRKEEARWQNETHPCMSLPCQAGDLELTDSGATLFFSARKRKDAARGRQPYQGAMLFIYDEPPGQIRFLAAHEADLREELEMIQAGSSGVFGTERQVESVVGPFAIGPWWVSRFELLPDGYGAEVRYKEPDGGNTEAAS